MKKCAFTLIELLVVIAIIMLLAGLLFPAFTIAQNVAKKTKAKAEVKQLEVAWKAVLSDYRSWSIASGGGTGGGSVPPYDAGPSLMLNGPRLFLEGNNTKGVTYMDFDRGSTNNNGSFIDPWYSPKVPTSDDHAYRVNLGTSMVTPYGVPFYRSVAAWSKGKDIGDDKDDVKSWE